MPANRAEISATLDSKAALRWTLTGVAVLDCKLKYAGLVMEAGSERKLNFAFNARAIGAAAESLDKEELGITVNAKGFLATSSPRSAKLVLHITEYDKGV